MEQETLIKLQTSEKDILVFIDEFCRKYDIKYFLYAGTALGAARHHGFIPWDDDTDIAMERNEYIKFIQKWNEVKPTVYHMQDPNTEYDRILRMMYGDYMQFPPKEEQVCRHNPIDIMFGEDCDGLFVKEPIYGNKFD